MVIIRQVRVRVNQTLAARDLAYSIMCALASTGKRRMLGDDDYDHLFVQSIFNGAWNLIDRVVANQVNTGRVPIPIFQALAALRSREIDLGNGRGMALLVVLQGGVTVGNPPIGATVDRADMSNFLNACAEVVGKGPSVDLSELNSTEGVSVEGFGTISVGKTPGPLSFMSLTGNGNPQYNSPVYKCVQSEQWMRLLGWAIAYDQIHFDMETITVDYPLAADNLVVRPEQCVTPGLTVLTRAIGNLSVLDCKTFMFPTYLLGEFAGYIAADAGARGIVIADPGDAVVQRKNSSGFFYSLAEVNLARVMVESGQVSGIFPLYRQGKFPLPQGPVEAACINACYRNNCAKLPVVADRLVNGAGVVNTVSSKAIDKVWANVLPCMSPLMATYASMFYPQTRLMDNNRSWSVLGPLGPTSAFLNSWGTSVTPGQTDTYNMSVIPDSNLFSQTISKGPLGMPGANSHMGGLNFTDVSQDLHVVYTVDPDFGPLYEGTTTAISYFGKGMKNDSDLKFMAYFPLSLDSLPAFPGTAVTTDWASMLTPARKIICNPGIRCDAYVQQAVTEDSAKNTEFQQIMSSLTAAGRGGGSWMGDMIRGAGNALSGLGVPFASVVGKGVGVIADHYYAEPPKPKKGKKKQQQKTQAKQQQMPKKQNPKNKKKK